MSELDEFERDLSKQLRRVPAPASLAESVMKQAAKGSQQVISFPQRSLWVRLAALFFLTALLAGAGTSLHHRHAVERAKAERDFARSQELISRALEPVRRQLSRAGVPLDE